MSTSSDVGSKLLAWIMTGVGTLLAYSAIKGRPPWDVLRDIEGTRLPAWDRNGPDGLTSNGANIPDLSPTAFSASVPRIRQIANREIPPVLVNIRPSGQLDKDAAAALERVWKRLGRVVPNTSAYRSFGQQAASYNTNNSTLGDGSPRFASPTKSLHVVGLAIDLNAGMVTPEVIAAMKAEGWQHVRPAAEPWHFSYLVRG